MAYLFCSVYNKSRGVIRCDLLRANGSRAGAGTVGNGWEERGDEGSIEVEGETKGVLRSINIGRERDRMEPGRVRSRALSCQVI